jgi:hypothetical protein
MDEDLTSGLLGLGGKLPELLIVAKTGRNTITTGNVPLGLFPRPNGQIRTLQNIFPARMRELDPESQPDMIVLHRYCRLMQVRV